MKCLARNLKTFYYCPYVGEEDVAVVDEGDTIYTGDKRIVYGKPVQAWGNISEARGQSQEAQFGNDVDYDKVIVICRSDFPMDENAVLFVDKMPSFDASGNPLYDYTIKKVARSLNSVSYAISKGLIS